jgi:sporulation protein YlmC with PRC-barrel domain
VDDVEVDTCTAQIVSIVICGHNKLFGVLGREPDIIIGWKEIEVIGEETILVNYTCPPGCGTKCRRGPQILGGLFR